MNTSVKHKGLTSHEAARLLKQYGANMLTPPPKPGLLRVMLSQYNNFLSILLIFAAIMATAIGEVLDGSLITTILLLNGIFGVYQEKKAESAIEALSQMSVTKVRVIRDGDEIEIDSKEIVPGDIMYLEEGSKIPADSEIVEMKHLEMNESALTGESLPVPKNAGEELFMGTIVSRGRGYARVTKTASHTKFGEIAAKLASIEQQRTPLQKKLESLSRWIGLVGILLSVVAFILSRLAGEALFDSFLLAAALAVAVVPVSVPAVLTMTLAIGVKELAKKNAIVRKLSSFEAFGSVTLIATDKTGTLTTNKMRVKEVYIKEQTNLVETLETQEKSATQSTELTHLLNCAVLCSTASLVPVHDHGSFDILGDPTEGAALILADKFGVDTNSTRQQWETIDEVSFDSVTKRMWVAVTPRDGKGDHAASRTAVIYAKGAPESILSVCSKVQVEGHEVVLSTERKAAIEQAFMRWAEKGLRVMAFAYAPVHEGHHISKDGGASVFHTMVDTAQLTFVGMVGIHDAPRPEVPDAVARAQEAGIKIVMITGDNEKTAEAIGAHVGIMRQGDEILNGSQLELYSDQQLLEKLDKVRIFARTTPLHKQRIVALYQKKGEIVAVTGDGVNDSIALKQADVGLAMGLIGTDVARETADIVIADDNFATIVVAIAEGRNVLKNVKNAIIYLLSCNIAEAFVLIGGLLLGLPPLFLPIQLLYINLVTDGLPALALAYSPHEDHLMKHPPQKTLKLLQKPEYIRIFIQGFWATIFVFASYFLFSFWGYSQVIITTATFTMLALIQSFIFIDTWLEHRSPFTHHKRMREPIFWFAFISPFIAHLAILYTPFLAYLFKAAPLPFIDLIFLILLASGILFVLQFFHKRSWISGNGGKP